MKSLVIAGIQRSALYSPNHVGNDAAIFSATADWLNNAGYKVKMYTEQEFLAGGIQEKVIVTMLRNAQAVHRLQELEKEGCVAVNSGFGIENCTRERMTKLLMDHDVPHPDSIIMDTHEDVDTYLKGKQLMPCWVKRGDFHAIHREDVTYVRKDDELREIIAEYALRGINRVVINEHLCGDLVKFYGVAGTNFFHWFYPFNENHSKFGHEEINGHPEGIPFSLDRLREICNQAAGVLKIVVYGGDCIVSPDGSIRIIDFNDWPSFAPCRVEASREIAKKIIQIINEHK
ncbi:hypothetical protein [uncultured Bacteroides sp.]|uniref:hypothetical protein n=1 Tax=uncultured Bacteroides sp. TaxID=162156 RepID=UPI002AA67896|nr:hypothetical protein [uncultured Bacteroides sp.]